MTKKSSSPKPPRIECRELPSFHARDLASVRRAFGKMMATVSRQAWLAKSEKDFAPMIIRAGWRGDSLFVFAELIDADIFTRATAHHQRFWELGDSFEIFLRPAGQRAYVELQISPNNFRLQLRYPDARAVALARKAGSAAEFLIRNPIFHSQTWLRPKEKKWFVLAKIPIASVSEKEFSTAGASWRFSFSRYDCTRGRDEPVISSTSPHAKPDFHRQRDWGTLRFVTDRKF